MRIYLAARYSRKEEMRELRDKLQARGHIITSRWIDSEFTENRDYTIPAPLGDRERVAIENLDDIYKADCIIAFTEPPGSPASRGGRHVEFGFAVATGKVICVVGHRENVFYYLPQIRFYETIEHLMAERGM